MFATLVLLDPTLHERLLPGGHELFVGYLQIECHARPHSHKNANSHGLIEHGRDHASVGSSGGTLGKSGEVDDAAQNTSGHVQDVAVVQHGLVRRRQRNALKRVLCAVRTAVKDYDLILWQRRDVYLLEVKRERLGAWRKPHALQQVWGAPQVPMNLCDGLLRWRRPDVGRRRHSNWWFFHDTPPNLHVRGVVATHPWWRR
mmetsp:Transcript_15313/g.41970  ORF Transcript_15313/g.41970 Transcript_15313/m.41970 type:complete len:201 (-) Transcript_15313:96-698(-)